MTDYNDGKWHGWNGGECPVHPKSRIEAVYTNSFGELRQDERSAENHMWNPSGMPKAATIAFRVIKAYREPREAWSYGAHMRNTLAEAEAFRAQVDEQYPGNGHLDTPIVHWREVLK